YSLTLTLRQPLGGNLRDRGRCYPGWARCDCLLERRATGNPARRPPATGAVPRPGRFPSPAQPGAGSARPVHSLRGAGFYGADPAGPLPGDGLAREGKRGRGIPTVALCLWFDALGRLVAGRLPYRAPPVG